MTDALLKEKVCNHRTTCLWEGVRVCVCVHTMRFPKGTRCLKVINGNRRPFVISLSAGWYLWPLSIMFSPFTITLPWKVMIGCYQLTQTVNVPIALIVIHQNDGLPSDPQDLRLTRFSVHWMQHSMTRGASNSEPSDVKDRGLLSQKHCDATVAVRWNPS